MEGYERIIKEQEDLIRRLRMDLQQRQDGQEDPAIFVDLNSGGDSRQRESGPANRDEGRNPRARKKRSIRDDEEEDGEDLALKQVFKKAKVDYFDGVNKTGEDLDAWIENLEDFFALKKFSEIGKAKVAAVHLRSVAKLWWKAYLKQRTLTGPVEWEEFKTQAEKRYCSPHYSMEKKMEFYGFKQQPIDQKCLTVNEYKEQFLRLHKYAPEVEGDALKSKFIEGLREDLMYEVKGAGATDFLDAVAKAENYEKKVKYMANKENQGRMIATGHRPQPRNSNPIPSRQGFNAGTNWRTTGGGQNNQRRDSSNFANRNTNQNASQSDNGRRLVRWQHDPEFIERARRLGLCFR